MTAATVLDEEDLPVRAANPGHFAKGNHWVKRGYMPFFFGGAFPSDFPAGFSGCLAITLSAIFL